jgi:hypothetical protein
MAIDTPLGQTILDRLIECRARPFYRPSHPGAVALKAWAAEGSAVTYIDRADIRIRGDVTHRLTPTRVGALLPQAAAFSALPPFPVGLAVDWVAVLSVPAEAPDAQLESIADAAQTTVWGRMIGVISAYSSDYTGKVEGLLDVIATGPGAHERGLACVSRPGTGKVLAGLWLRERGV